MQTIFIDAKINLEETIARYDLNKPYHLSARRRRGRELAGIVTLIAISRGKKHVALLRQLGKEDTLLFPNSLEGRQINDHNLPLCGISFAKRNRYPPTFTHREGQNGAPHVPLREWLRGAVFIGENFNLSRADVCWIASTQDGWRHADKWIKNPAYRALEHGGPSALSYHKNGDGDIRLNAYPSSLHVSAKVPSKGYIPKFGGPPQFIKGGLEGTIRAIAGELLSAIDDIQFIDSTVEGILQDTSE